LEYTERCNNILLAFITQPSYIILVVILILLLSHGKSGYANAPHCYVYAYSVCLVIT
jgi:hypothetical protein